MIEHTKTKMIYNVGESKVFPFNIRFFEPTDLKVSLNDKILKLDRDYEVELKSDYSNGANITILTDIKKNDKLVIKRALPLTQLLDIPEYGKVSPQELEDAFDRIIMSLQELDESVFKYSGDNDFDFESLIADLKKVQHLVSNSDSVSESATKAAVSAAQALISAMNAARYAEEAKATSGIPEHNTASTAHSDIRDLIQNLQDTLNSHTESYTTHVANYNKHVSDNSTAHNTMNSNISKVTARVSALETKVNNTETVENKNYFYTFGYNNNCQLGLNWTRNITSPMSHIGLRNVSKIASSASGGVCIADGRLYVTGAGSNGLCGGDRQAVYGYKVHPSVDTIYGWTDAACYGQVAMAILEGDIYSWGDGGNYCLGDGSTLDRAVPRKVSMSQKFTQVVAGTTIMLALTTDGDVYSCGKCSWGALGHGIASEKNAKLTIISNIDCVKQIAAGGFISDNKSRNFCAVIGEKHSQSGGSIVTETKLYTWGYNGYGQLGHGNTTNLSAPKAVSLSFTPKKVACGAAHIAVLDTAGNVYLCGAKNATRKSANTTTFYKLEFSKTAKDIACGRDVTYILGTDNVLYAVGTPTNNSMLSKTSKETSTTPVALVSGQKISAVFSFGQNYSCSYTVEA